LLGNPLEPLFLFVIYLKIFASKFKLRKILKALFCKAFKIFLLFGAIAYFIK